jgi:dipeptide/tripeptide permease
MVYLTREFHLDQVHASNILNIWSGLTNFAPLLGAFVSDTYAGRFRTIAFASFFSLAVCIINFNI